MTLEERRVCEERRAYLEHPITNIAIAVFAITLVILTELF